MVRSVFANLNPPHPDQGAIIGPFNLGFSFDVYEVELATTTIDLKTNLYPNNRPSLKICGLINGIANKGEGEKNIL